MPPAIVIPRKHKSRRRFYNSPPRARPGPENLRQYLKDARIPSISRFDRSGPYCLPLKGRRTHKNKLKIRHEADRHLTTIKQEDAKEFDDAVNIYHKEYIYGHNARPFAGKHYSRRGNEALVLSSGVYTREEEFEDIPYPSNIEETCRWVVERPLRTMERAIHLAFPDTTRWWLDEANADMIPNWDQELWRTYLWRFHPDEYQKVWWQEVPGSESGVETQPAPHESMVFAVQSPWILGPEDLKNVSDCTSLPSCNEDGTPPEAPLKAAQRVWGKLYDTCKAVDCRTFALTNYDGWLFGTFSDDWTTARTSEVKAFDTTCPNVMQSLVYWVAASLDLIGARHWLVPVTEETQDGPKKA